MSNADVSNQVSTRRNFLFTAARSSALLCAAPVAFGAGTAKGNADRKRTPIVDTHMHVWADDPSKFPFAHPYNKNFEGAPHPGTVEMLIDDMDAAGVTHSILVQVIYHGWDNSYLVDCLKKYPGRFAAQGLIDPTDPDAAAKLEYWVAKRGLAGMRFSPIYYRGTDDWLSAKSSNPLWEKAAELGAVFNLFIAPEQLPKLQTMIQRFPEVHVVVDHLSQIDLGIDNPQPALDKLLALARYPKVSVKVSELTSVSKSGTYPFRDALPWVKQVYDAFGPDRLLWGTGYPGTARAHFKRPTLKRELDLIRNEIPFFTSADQAKILGENAARIWKLKV